jgi:hypothetical protein
MPMGIRGKSCSMVLCGMALLSATAAQSAENWTRYTNENLHNGGSLRMKSVDTHICMMTGIVGNYTARDEEQIRRVGDDWHLFGAASAGGTYTRVEATCYAHADFYARTGGVGRKSFSNSISWARAVASPTTGCQAYRQASTGDATGILYMRGINAEFEDPFANPAPWNSYAAIVQATQLTIPGTNPIQPAKSSIQVRVDACTGEFYYLPWVPADYTQRARLAVGWYKIGSSGQMPKFMTSDRRREFPTNSRTEFKVSASDFGTREVGMALTFEGACYLTYFGGGAGSISIQARDGQWKLIARSNGDGHAVAGRARCYAYNQGDLYVGPSPS